jgi:light-regulated signal transduction histidine kinase (bacteriophytochrome)
MAHDRSTEALDRQRDLEHVLDAFSYSVAHDLRAPLRAINGFSRTLLEDYQDKLDADGVELLGLIQSSAMHMGHLIDSLVTFSRVSRQPLRRQSFAATDLVQRAIDELKPELAGRAVDLRIGELSTCEGDPNLLHQV